MTLGSAEDCTLRVDTPGIPGHAVRLIWDDITPELILIQDPRSGRAPLVAGEWGESTSKAIAPGQGFEIAGTRFVWPGGDSLTVIERADRAEEAAASQAEKRPTAPAPPPLGLTADDVIISLGRTDDGQPRTLSLAGLSCPVGTLIALIGPSGVGKSTLLRSLLSATGQTAKTGGAKLGESLLHTIIGGPKPTLWTGHLNFRGSALRSSGRDRVHSVALVPQEAILVPDLPMDDVMEQTYWLKQRGDGHRDQAERTIVEALRCAGLTMADIKGKYANEFSGGQQKRLSLALERMSYPDLLLLDEPNSGLDPDSDRELINALTDVAHDLSSGSVIIVTHTLTHIPDDAYAVALGLAGPNEAVVAYHGNFAGLYPGLGASDDADLMKKLKTGTWRR
jgi:ABC-type multidrug transport system ATPase subunit